MAVMTCIFIQSYLMHQESALSIVEQETSPPTCMVAADASFFPELLLAQSDLGPGQQVLSSGRRIFKIARPIASRR